MEGISYFSFIWCSIQVIKHLLSVGHCARLQEYKKKKEEGCEKEGRREGGIIIVFYLGSREAKNDTDIIKSLY